MKTYLDKREYDEYLAHMIDAIFQILPLFEEENPYLEEYVDSLLEFEIKGATALQDMKKEKWFPIVITTLTSIHRKIKHNEEIKHKQLRREIFKLTNLLDNFRKRGNNHE